MSRTSKMLIIAIGMTVASAAAAQETTTYSYDALGRLTEVDASSSAGEDTLVELEYDDAGNRVSQETTGAARLPGLRVIPVADGKVVVVVF